MNAALALLAIIAAAAIAAVLAGIVLCVLVDRAYLGADDMDCHP
jgi:hypothetical protein